MKVHTIEGAASFDYLANDYKRLKDDRGLLLDYIRNALRIKQNYIEIDEFDHGIRNIFNYGHSFGHAIESATDYRIPHGIVVTMGMDVANSIAVMRSLMPTDHFRRMHHVLHDNYRIHANEEIDQDLVLDALMKDKKNTSTQLALILPHGEDIKLKKVLVTPDQEFREQCRIAFEQLAD